VDEVDVEAVDLGDEVRQPAEAIVEASKSASANSTVNGRTPAAVVMSDIWISLGFGTAE
jgi:hypothetical protein